jgi:hypothetical protein
MAELSDAAFIHNFENWPRWPLCPVVNRTTGKAGMIHAQDTLTVHVDVNLWSDTFREDFDKAEKKSYPSHGALADEWRVD